MARCISVIAILLIMGFLWQCQTGSNDNNSQDEQAQKGAPPEVLKKQGRTIAKASGKALMQQLQTAIAKGGIPHAVQFCSRQAISLTDSLSAEHGASIHRISYKNRNPVNAADSLEKKLIRQYQQKLQAGAKPTPELIKRDEKQVYYHPIRIKNGLCLNCHGKLGKMLSNETLELLRDRYPKGKAIGFEVGDLRGLWKIQFQETTS